MKKRILAAILAVTMVLSICVGANAGYEPVGDSIVVWDMEDEQPEYADYGKAMTVSETEGVDGSKCLVSPGDGTWAVSPMSTVLFTAEAGKSYEISLWFKGALYQATAWTGNANNPTDMKIERVGASAVSDWAETSFIVSGFDSETDVGLQFQEGGSSFYVDDISVCEVVEVADPTPTPISDLLVYEEDFEGYSAECWPEFTIEYDPLDETNKVGSITETSWETKLTEPLLKEVDPEQIYTMQVSVYGDVSNMGICYSAHWEKVTVSDGENTASNMLSVDADAFESLYVRPLANEWDTYVVTFSGKDQYCLFFIAQSAFGVNNATFMVDDVKIYKGNCLDELKAMLPQENPTPDSDLIESPHDYPENYDNTWTIYKEDATSVAVTFSEDTYVEDDYDYIIIYDGDDEEYATYTGDQLAGETVLIQGDTVKIRLKSDESLCYYGFAVTKVEAYYDGETPDWWTPTPEPTPTPTILVNPEISPEVVEPGTKVSLPDNSLVTDGGFEKVRYDDSSYPQYTYVDAFTATDEYGYSTERFADYVQIVDDKDFAVEGDKSILLQSYEAATIAMPNLYKYRGGELVFEYYVQVEDDTPFMTLGYFEDRSIVEETYEDEYGDEYKIYKMISMFTNIATNLDEEEITENIYRGNWVKMTERMTVPDDLSEDNECVIYFTSLGNAIYLDAVSCVLYDRDGKEVRYVDGVLLDPTPEPTPTPLSTPTASPIVSVTPSPTATVTATPTATVEPTKPPVKKSVRFTKKKVTIKKGKKKVLKVKIKGAKKAKFSVNKKGKKVVKLMKKKAKKVTVKGKKKGKAVITAKAAGKKAKCKVTVK